MIMNRPVHYLLSVASLVASAEAASGQDSLRVAVGSRVRVTAEPSFVQVGTVGLLRHDTLWLASRSLASPVEYPLARVQLLEVSAGRHVNRRAALTGIFVGALVGGILGDLHSVRTHQPAEAPAGAVLGGLVGAIPPFMFARERWARVPILRRLPSG